MLIGPSIFYLVYQISFMFIYHYYSPVLSHTAADDRASSKQIIVRSFNSYAVPFIIDSLFRL